MIDKNEFEITSNEFSERVERAFGVSPSEADERTCYHSLASLLAEELFKRRDRWTSLCRTKEAKKVYYLSMEFLTGKNMSHAARCLGISDKMNAILSGARCPFDFETLCAVEKDPGLGNGGLGRLAACYLSSLSSLSYPAIGYSICYEQGFFTQKIADGEQIEQPDDWLKTGTCWLSPDRASARTVRLGGTVRESWGPDGCSVSIEDADEIEAIPYDMPVPGADGVAVNVLRLWRAGRKDNDFEREKGRDEWDHAAVSRSLYPKDDLIEGKMLRLTQQFFLVSASVADIVSNHLSTFGTLESFSEKTAIHINDTHPALVIPELMRVFMDEYRMSWDDAWRIVTETVSYTNHTVMPEALETWNADLFKLRLPRMYTIIREINERQSVKLWERYPGDFDRISRMSQTAYSRVRMAPLCIAASHRVNGVSKIHTAILKEGIFRDFNEYEPEKIVNVTNGVSHLKWLIEANPRLASLIKEAIGDRFERDPSALEELTKYENDETFLKSLASVKRENKLRLSEYCKRDSGARIDPDSVFDVHIKRFHEYKRQLMNALKILYLYKRIKDGDGGDIPQTTFIFGGKAAPGYRIAKTVLRLIWRIGDLLASDKDVRDVLRVVFAENYGVTSAEIIIPSAQISEQISLAGKEASGTGCMKMMMNGALLLGTSDGANAEIADAVGDENAYIFGVGAEEANRRAAEGYRSMKYYIENERIRTAVDMLDAVPDPDGFDEIKRYLLYSGPVPDPYMCLLDFDPYYCAWEKAARDAADEFSFSKKSLVNVSKSGFFSSDRAVSEYAEKIWKLEKLS